jgi:hypothetical protein
MRHFYRRPKVVFFEKLQTTFFHNEENFSFSCVVLGHSDQWIIEMFIGCKITTSNVQQRLVAADRFR